MTLAEQLREYNDWRRGGDFSQPNPRDLGVLIDKSADRLEAAEKLIEQLEDALRVSRGALNSQFIVGCGAWQIEQKNAIAKINEMIGE